MLSTILTLALLSALQGAGAVHVTAAIGLPALATGGAPVPAGEDVLDQWYSEEQAAIHTRHVGLVMDLDQKIAYVIDHDERFYVEMDVPLDFTGGQARGRMLPETTERLEGRISLPQTPQGENRVTVTRTKEKARIGRWECTRYDVALSDPNSRITVGKIWATTDVPKDIITTVNRIRPTLLQVQYRLARASLRNLLRIRGLIVAVEWNRGVPGALQAIDIAESAPPPGTFQPPPGYARRPLLPATWTWR